MSTQVLNKALPAAFKSLSMMLCGLLILSATGCKEPGKNPDSDGVIINQVPIPTSLLLNFACADVGIFTETCVLSDPENPFLGVAILEFDANNPGAENKFELFNNLPSGPSGAKAKFYFWATALARRASGENQWYTARALHELYNYNNDPLIKEQALRAYRSVLDNFFGSVTFFECCGGVAFSVGLNELVARDLVLDATGFTPLIEGDALDKRAVLAQWGYTYDVNVDIVFVNEG